MTHSHLQLCDTLAALAFLDFGVGDGDGKAGNLASFFGRGFGSSTSSASQSLNLSEYSLELGSESAFCTRSAVALRM